jgi:N6-adenosine-specific RNA methylase IME4
LSGPYEIIYADFPWPHYGSPEKDAAAAKHYQLMEMAAIRSFPMREMMAKRAILFLWATGPRLNLAFEAIEAWKIRYLGVSFVWVKCAKDGHIIHGQGPRPSVVKSNIELLLAATNVKSGRPLPLLTEAMGQVVLAPRGAHSAKPPIFREKIVQLLGDRPRVELFSREAEGTDGWVHKGIESDGTTW